MPSKDKGGREARKPKQDQKLKKTQPAGRPPSGPDSATGQSATPGAGKPAAQADGRRV